MECFIRIGFWIFTFIALSGCRPTLPMEDFQINFIREQVSCPSDAEFYSPKNVKPECITSALECVLKELKTVKTECDDPDERIDQGAEALHMQIMEDKETNKSSVQTNSNKCACESWPQVPFKEFLNNYERLIQQRNDLATIR